MVAHNLAFDEAVRIASRRIDTAAAGNSEKKLTAPEDLIGTVWNWEEAKKKDPLQLTEEEKADTEKRRDAMRAMDVRYESLKQGESLGKLTHEEHQELVCMETGHGWCLNLVNKRPPERIGQRRSNFIE